MQQLIDLSHIVEAGMITYKGLPAPIICDYLSREASRSIYAEGIEFNIGKIEMVANTGTYVDSPFHRYAEGKDLSELPLRSLADLPGIVVRQPCDVDIAVGVAAFEGLDVAGKAVLVHTGWDRHWRSERYGREHSFLTADAADWLIERGAVLVGIDSNNIDDTRVRRRPVHTKLLGADIPVCEHMTGLGSLPDEGFR